MLTTSHDDQAQEAPKYPWESSFVGHNSKITPGLHQHSNRIIAKKTTTPQETLKNKKRNRSTCGIKLSPFTIIRIAY